MPLPARTWLVILFGLMAVPVMSFADDAKPKRVLFVTHSSGFVHDSVGVAEDVLTELGPKNGFVVTTYRFTGDPKARVKVKGKNKDDAETEVNALEAYNKNFRPRTGKSAEPENCGRINKETLKNFDCVVFFTTGNPLTKEELADLTEWIKAGGAFCGTHCATDTNYDLPAYGELIGGYFKAHPSGIQKVKLRVEDPKHPAAKGLENGMPYDDEIYIFKDEPYNRQKLHIILSADDFDLKKYTKKAEDVARMERKDGDYAISWCKEIGKGKVFYTSLGHQKKVWNDPVFQTHLVGGLKWAMGQAPGSAAPSKSKDN